jgi:gluconate 2-dehydrogenase gamma chain
MMYANVFQRLARARSSKALPMVDAISFRQAVMTTYDLTRRHFLAACAMASGAIAISCKSRPRTGWEFLDEENALTLAGICDQIVPADDFPSASQAGVLIYIDRQLTHHYAKYQHKYIRGLKTIDEISRKEFGRRFALLDSHQQLRIVGAIESTDRDFFELVRSHTLEGYYGAPRHGGNRDAVSWRMLGLAEPPLRGRAPIIAAKSVRS